jgi:hypothetical protein
MATRRTVLVGSLPGADAEQAMSAALNAVGGSLTAITDGETGDRSRWLAHLIETFRDHPDLEVAKDGDQSDYQHMLNHRVRRGHRLDPASFDLGYLAAYRESRPVFDRLRDAHRRPDLSFQVGIGGDFDLALFAMGPLGALRHRGVFAAATAREITQIQRDSTGDVLFQVEIPAETLFTARSGPLAPLVARRMAAGVHRLAAVTPAGTRYALHLCVGDLGHKAMSTPRSTTPLVTLANALARRWPADRPLERLHLPLAAGDRPAPHDPRFYQALRDLRLPPEVRLAAGFLHESRTIDEQRALLAVIERAVGHPVDVAAACGLGRRHPDQANATLTQAAALTS